MRYDEVLPPGDRKASSTVPDFTTIRAGAFVFVPPTVQVLFVAPRRSFTTSHSYEQMHPAFSSVIVPPSTFNCVRRRVLLPATTISPSPLMSLDLPSGVVSAVNVSVPGPP